MRNKLFLFFLILFVGIFSIISNQVQAFGLGVKPFGGKIIKSKATEVENIEYQGFRCPITNDSIAINPVVGGLTYYIPSVNSKTIGGGIQVGQWIMGLYTPSSATITCTNIKQPPTPPTMNVILNKINIYGTSK